MTGGQRHARFATLDDPVFELLPFSIVHALDARDFNEFKHKWGSVPPTSQSLCDRYARAANLRLNAIESGVLPLTCVGD